MATVSTSSNYELQLKFNFQRLLNRLLSTKSTMNTRPATTSKPKGKYSVKKASESSSVVNLPQEGKVVDPSKWERG